MFRYDTVVIGAGIAGALSGYFLKKMGHSVLVLDRSGIASTGGSASAGAFISPKIGKGSALQQLTNKAFEFAQNFYSQNFPKFFHQTGVLRIPKDEIDAQKFYEYAKFNTSKVEWRDGGFFFPQAGVCDAPKMCKAILEGIEYRQLRVEKLIQKGEFWEIEDIQTKNIILATGYQNELLDMRYMGVKGLWGSRGDYISSLDLRVSMHKKISISANIDGIIKIGATHIKSQDPCMECNGKPLQRLEKLASTMVDTTDFQLKEIFCGMRSGSRDHFPLVGEVIDVPHMLERYPKILRGAKAPLKRVESLYICNGFGGRGFVFAPLMGKILADHIVYGTTIDGRVNPDRLFFKWCRRLNS